MFKKLLLTSIILFASLGFSKVADAHVTLNPDQSEPGSYDKYDVRVPVEKDANTNKVELNVPDGVNVANVQPVDGWKHKLDKDSDGNIKKITWSAEGKGIGPDEFTEFPIVVANPEDEGTFKWKAIQSYDNGEKVKWTNEDEDSDTPAPATEVKKGVEDESSNGGFGTTALWIVSIVAIILSLIALFKKPSSKS
ncbi:YcnI family copper-binding membrane protein [Staphylococcus auricularis]|uniref:Nuclear export factor GLE1 n=1 Tax=Staphylococcus auricularis TaxID=29379 RepID=A0ABX5IG41_9STAP|nr:YcnI family protein [Staphylococcus auricularis]MCE5039228.1 YcnI family protein [Staphylococcus auricularis]MEB6570396.1 YcnI family protein [Staphylococcus auricularis]PTH19048.1 nuclear export factor GLE1 [Staphylococcus auricularis]PTH26365.1 nuclear export factor GLE1 [Staphylococcus auricularis]